MNRLPFEIAAEIYEYLDLEYSDRTRAWIMRNTGRSDHSKSRKRRTASQYHIVDKHEVGDKIVYVWEDDNGNRRTKTKLKGDLGSKASYLARIEAMKKPGIHL